VDDSWPATVLSVVPSYSHADSNLIGPAHGFPCVLLNDYGYWPHYVQFIGKSDPETPKMVEPYFRLPDSIRVS